MKPRGAGITYLSLISNIVGNLLSVLYYVQFEYIDFDK